MIRWLIGLGLAAVLAAIVAMVMWPVDTPPQIRAKFEDRARAELPGAQLAADGDVRLYLARGGEVLGLDLVDLQIACRKGSAPCRAAGDQLLAGARRVFDGGPLPEVPALRPTLGGPPAAAPFAGDVLADPFVDTLKSRYAFFDGPVTRYLTRALATRLQLDPALAGPRAVAAMESAGDAPVLRPLLGRQGVSFLEGPGDPAGEALSTARLNVLLERTGLKRVYVAFPVRGMLVVSNPGSATGLADLKAVVAEMPRAAATQALSARIFLYEDGKLTPVP